MSLLLLFPLSWGMRFLLIIILFSPIWAFAQSLSGVLIIRFPYRIEDRKLALYESEKDQKPVWMVSNLEQMDSLLLPVFTYGGTPFVTYRCDIQHKDRLFIRAYDNPEKGYWIVTDSLMEFESWDEWFTGFGRITTNQTNPVRKNPADTGMQFVRSCDCSLFGLDSVSGDWMLISYDPTCEDYYLENCPAEKTQLPGWIRWRKGDAILADVYIAE